MESEWQTHEVSDLISEDKLVVGDGYRAKNDELGKQGRPFARAGNINDGFQFTDADRFPLENLGRVGNKVSQPGDVVFTSKGTVGRFAFVKPHTEQFVYSPQLCFWRSLDQDLIDSRFLYYWMLGPEFYVQFKGVAGQTDMAEYVSLTDQRRMRITVPCINAQRAIAHILGTLDDKIELNRKMNETLEATALALYKSWFIDFDPVCAKAEGRDPCLPVHIANLFPDSFIDAEIGEIPMGWRVDALLSDAKLLSGGTPKTDVDEYWSGDILWASAKDVSQSPHSFLVSTDRRITSVGLERSATQLIPALSTVVVARGATTGRMVIFGKEMAMNQTCYAIVSSMNSPFTLYCRLRQEIDGLVHAAHGSVFDTITTSTFAQAKTTVAPQAVSEQFELLVGPLFRRILANVLQSLLLTDVRDTFLPKLISGELRVGDTQRIGCEES